MTLGPNDTCPRRVSLGVHADADPYPAYLEVADEAAIAWDDGFGGWIALRHAECSRVLRDVESFVMPWSVFDGGDVALGKYGIFNLNGDFHERVHRSLLDYFNPRKNKDLVHLVQHVVQHAFDDVADQPVFEFHGTIAERVPGMMAFRFMGLPEDLDLLHLVHDANGALQRFMQSYAGSGSAEVADLRGAHESLLPYFGPVIRARRQERRNDLISQLWDFADGRTDWGEEEMIRQCLFYFGASFGNTANALTNAAHTMLTDSDHRELLRTRPDYLPAFAEEAMRVWSAIQFRIRIATRDADVAGVQIRAGEKVILAVGSANRDADVFPRPDKVELNRTNVLRHLTFGAGQRYCVGATLARLEIQEALRALNERYAEIELDPRSARPSFAGANYRHFSPLVLRGRQLTRPSQV